MRPHAAGEECSHVPRLLGDVVMLLSSIRIPVHVMLSITTHKRDGGLGRCAEESKISTDSFSWNISAASPQKSTVNTNTILYRLMSFISVSRCWWRCTMLSNMCHLRCDLFFFFGLSSSLPSHSVICLLPSCLLPPLLPVHPISLHRECSRATASYSCPSMVSRQTDRQTAAQRRTEQPEPDAFASLLSHAPQRNRMLHACLSLLPLCAAPVPLCPVWLSVCSGQRRKSPKSAPRVLISARCPNAPSAVLYDVCPQAGVCRP